MEIYLPTLKHLLLAGFLKQFCQYVTMELVAVHDWNSAQYNHDSSELELFGVDGEHMERQRSDTTTVLQVAVCINNVTENALILCFVLCILCGIFLLQAVSFTTYF